MERGKLRYAIKETKFVLASCFTVCFRYAEGEDGRWRGVPGSPAFPDKDKAEAWLRLYVNPHIPEEIYHEVEIGKSLSAG